MFVALSAEAALFKKTVDVIQAGEIADKSFPASLGRLAEGGEIDWSEAPVGRNYRRAHRPVLMGAGAPQEILFLPQCKAHSFILSVLIVYCPKL